MRGYRPNWPFVLGAASCFVVPYLVSLVDYNPRLTGAGLGLVAFVLLAYQGVANYRETQTAGRVAVVLILSSLLIVAWAQVALDGEAVTTGATYVLIGQRWGCLLFAICYRRILGLGTRSPWVRPREAGSTDRARLPA
jgi:hypothetical protein